MFDTLRGKFVRLFDDFLYKATVNNYLPRMWYTFLLVILVGIPMLVIASPALILFSISNKVPEHRDLLQGIGIAWLLILISGIVVAIPLLVVKAIKEAIHKHKVIKEYSQRKSNKR